MTGAKMGVRERWGMERIQVVLVTTCPWVLCLPSASSSDEMGVKHLPQENLAAVGPQNTLLHQFTDLALTGACRGLLIRGHLPYFSHLFWALDAADHGPLLLKTLPFPSFIINPCLSAPLFPGTLAPSSPLRHLTQVLEFSSIPCPERMEQRAQAPYFFPPPLM